MSRNKIKCIKAKDGSIIPMHQITWIGHTSGEFAIKVGQDIYPVTSKTYISLLLEIEIMRDDEDT